MPFNLPWYDASQYPDLKSAVEDIGAEPATLLIASRLPLGSSAVTIPNSLALKFFNGAQLVVGVDEQLVIAGPVEAGPYPVFSGEGRVRFQQAAPRRDLHPGWSPMGGGVPEIYHGAGVLEGYYPQWFGAVMGERGAAEANHRAVGKLMAALPDTGGVMLVTDELFVSDTITYPKRQYGSINFTIRGTGATSRIVQVSESTDSSRPPPPAIVMQWVTEVHYSVRTSKQVLKDITVVSQGNGVEVTGGGKAVVLSNLIVARCKGEYGLLLQEFYGGVIDRVYCFANDNVGARLHQCAMVDLHGLTARQNGGAGIELSACSGLSGYLYSESNQSWALDAQDLGNSTFVVWFENSYRTGGLNSLQARLRNCCHNRFFGKTGAHRNVAFDADPISRALNLVDSAVPLYGDMYHWRLASDFFGMINGAVTQLGLDNSFSGTFSHVGLGGWGDPQRYTDDPNFPYVTVARDDQVGYSDQASLRIMVKANAFAHRPQPATSAWIEVFRWGQNADQSPLGTLEYKQGDRFLIRFRARTDAAGAAFYRDKIMAGAGYALSVSFQGGGPPGTGLFTLTDQDWHTFELRPQAEADGRGLRLFFYVGTGVDSGPGTEHHIWIDDVEVYHIPDTDRYTPAAPPILINEDGHGYPQGAKTFEPGMYITAPQLQIRSDITTPLTLGGKKIFYADDIPNEITERGSLCFNTKPTPEGYVGWSCVYNVELLTTNERHVQERLLHIPVSGLAVGDKVGVVVQDTGQGVANRQRVHWTTIKSLQEGADERVEMTDPTPANTFVGPGFKVYVMRWKPFGAIAGHQESYGSGAYGQASYAGSAP